MVHKVVDTAIQLHGALGYQPGYAAGAVVHPSPLAAPGRRSGRGAPLDASAATSSRRSASTARRRAPRVGTCCRRRAPTDMSSRRTPGDAGTTKTNSDSVFRMSKHAFAISPRVPREFFWKSFALGDQRAQGKPDARCTRGLVCNVHKKAHTSIQVQRRHSGLPCAMVLRLISRSPR